MSVALEIAVVIVEAFVKCNYFHISPSYEAIDFLGAEDPNVVFIEKYHVSRHKLHLLIKLVNEVCVFELKHISWKNDWLSV